MAVLPLTADGGLSAIGASPKRDGVPLLSVRRISLTNFRSYASAIIDTDGRPVVLVGPNGAGKTNLLDAISLLSPGRGLRGARLSEHVRKAPTMPDASLWAVAATVSRQGETYEIGTGLAHGPSGERRLVRMNGAPAQSSADLAGIVQLLWLTPTMDRLFIEGAGGRRRFLDRLVLGFDASHARTSLRYETAMRERARLLKFGPRDPVWLDGLEAEMSETGIAVASARAETVAHLNAALEERRSAGAFPCAQLSLVGEVDASLVELSPSEAQQRLRERLAALRSRDAESGRTGAGPQLSDLAVRHTAKRSEARECSTGEQKALLISIVLADAWELARRRDGLCPVLLLDEVAAHLDAKRRSALFEEIQAMGAQAWMTGTDSALFSDLAGAAQIFVVDDGRFLPNGEAPVSQ